MSLSPGDQVDRYVVEQVLGEGGMAIVYQVRHRLLGTAHALKVLYSTRTRPQDLIAEGLIQARLDHPNLLPVRDVLDVAGAPALLLPLVEGPSLKGLLAVTRLKPDQAAGLLRGITLGVEAAHAQGLVHRDLKPGNVLLDLRRGGVVPRVSDFGVAARLADLKHASGPVVGTPAYAAPEQLAGGAVDQRADLWSLGCVLYEMLAGTGPFGEGGLSALLERVQRGDLTPLADRAPDTPAPLVELVDALLYVDPARRLPSARALLTRLEAAVPHAERALGPDAPLSVAAHWLGSPAEPAALEAPRWTTGRETWIDLGPPEEDHAETLEQRYTTTASWGERHNLPRERDTFIGRESELAALTARFEEDGAALVTLLGPGGAGKTRLARRFALEQLDAWPGGAWFCDLTEAETLEGVCVSIARGLNLPVTGADPIATLESALLARGRALVILDNAEQVLAPVAAVLGRWLEVAPRVGFLVTSRERVGLHGEVLLPLGPLDPSPAVALFASRARAARPDFALTEQSRADVVELVRLLDGLPLAIELAAARTRLLSPAQLLERISRRFDLLRSTRRDVTPRQATLRATIDWSWDLLEPWAQAALAQLSVFEDGFTLEAAEAVLDLAAWPQAPWPEDVVTALLDKSLLRREEQAGRVGFYVSVHAYAAERLAEGGHQRAAEERHGAWFARFGEPEAMLALETRGGDERLSTLGAELENVVAATRRAVARGDAGQAAPLVLIANRLLLRQGPDRIRDALLESVIALEGLPPALAWRVHSACCLTMMRAGRLQDAEAQLTLALARARDVDDMRAYGLCEVAAGRLALSRGEMDGAAQHLLDAGSLLSDSGHPSDMIGVLTHLGHVRQLQGRLDDAAALCTTLLELCEEVGARLQRSRACMALGMVRADQGRVAEAERLYRRALEFVEGPYNESHRGVVLSNLGITLSLRGKVDEARTAYLESLQIFRRTGQRLNVAGVLVNLGFLELRAGRPRHGLWHLQRGLAQLEDEPRSFIRVSAEGACAEALARTGQLDEARAMLERSEPRIRALGAEPLLVLWLCNKGQVACVAGDVEAAEDALQEASRVANGPPEGTELRIALHRLAAAVASLRSPRRRS
ncbi:MAG: tetratricopeptide repeat protein [Alphaproteobacteria bacterium]|nr:tetratricopeptide repeat protein [Alphaproteobacteria bacterium]